MRWRAVAVNNVEYAWRRKARRTPWLRPVILAQNDIVESLAHGDKTMQAAMACAFVSDCQRGTINAE